MNTESLSKIIESKLNDNINELSTQYFSNKKNVTSKFFIIDNLLPENIPLEVYNNFPAKEEFSYSDTFRERKFTFKKLNSLKNPIVNDVTNAFQMNNVINAIERITKTQYLNGDPSLYAGGISRMDFGHFLNPHIDNSHDANRERYRRFNLLYYVTPDIKEIYGGNFELWNKEVKTPLKIESKFNRLVVIETTKYSAHSVDPVLSKIKRCCVSNYYFSKQSPEDYEYYHVTSFFGRPEEKFNRIYGKFDNFIRNKFSKITRISRKKGDIRSK